jgi:pimeloyl-ACP methyl ester carboxylesterase
VGWKRVARLMASGGLRGRPPDETIPMRSHHVLTEGDDLYFEVRGDGPALLMIPGGGGDGYAYSFVAGILADEFKIITYDRRANARSSMNHPDRFDIRQQSRDAVAVLHAAGTTSAFIFGNSSGAVIALDLAASHPEVADAIVAHEPPLARVHPDAEKWTAFFQRVYETWRRFGRAAAMLRFALGIGVDFSFLAAARAVRTANRARSRSRQSYINRRTVIDYFLGRELLPVTSYVPDFAALAQSRGKLFMAAGRKSLEKKRFYAEVAPILAEMIECEFVLFPGHHGSFVDMPEAWATALRDVLHKASPSTTRRG